MALKYNPISGQFDLVDPSKWTTDSPGIIYSGHIAVGADADVDGTGPVNSVLQDIFGVGTSSSVIGVQEIMTGTPDVYNTGLQIKAVANFGSSATSFFGIEAMGATATGNTKDLILLGGFFGGAVHRGTGAVTNAYGVPALAINTAGGSIVNAFGIYGTVQNGATGTITNGTALYAANNSNGGGTLTTSYGLYIETQSGGSTNYNIYSAGGSANNYFAGYIRTSNTGGFYMNAAGSINNRFKINENTTAVAAAECIITPSSTARIPMVYQGLASQSANLNEWQKSDGTVLANFTAAGLLQIQGTYGSIVASLGASGTGDSKAELALYNAGTKAISISSKDTSPNFVNKGTAYTQLVLGANTATNGTQLEITNNAAGKVGIFIKAHASQTANLQEWQDSGGNILRSISATGAISKRVVSVSDATSITPNNDTSDIVTQANTQSAGTLTINAPSGTPTDGQELTLRIKSTNVQTFSFNAIYRGSTDTPLPVSTYAGSTTIYMKFLYNSTDTKWDMVSVTDGY